MSESTKTISPLRQRMIDDMVMRKLSPKTQTGYIRHVKEFSEYLGRSPQTATSEDLRLYQLHYREDRYQVARWEAIHADAWSVRSI